MSTLQLIIVCCTLLAVVAVAAWVVHELVKDATSTRIVLAQQDRDAAHARHTLEVTAKSADTRALRELELREQANAAQRDRAIAEEQSLVGRAVLINTTGATAISGVVHADVPARLTLRDATVLKAGSDAEAPAGGLLHVFRSRIDLVQEIPASAAGEDA